MTHPRDMDDLLREWADEGDERMPSHNLEAALAAIETAPQRGARPALLEGILMRLRPFAVPAAIVATLVLAVATFALVSRPPAVGPESSASPTPTRTSGDFQTSTFGVTLSIDLTRPIDPAGWYLSETDSALTISVTGAGDDRLVLLDGTAASVMSAAGEPLPLGDDLPAALNAVDGVTAEPVQRFDLEAPTTIPVDGEDVPVTAVTVDTSAAGRTVFRTTGGSTFSTTPDGGWWMLRLRRAERDLVVLLPAVEGAAADYSAVYLGLIETIVLR